MNTFKLMFLVLGIIYAGILTSAFLYSARPGEVLGLFGMAWCYAGFNFSKRFV